MLMPMKCYLRSKDRPNVWPIFPQTRPRNSGKWSMPAISFSLSPGYLIPKKKQTDSQSREIPTPDLQSRYEPFQAAKPIGTSEDPPHSLVYAALLLSPKIFLWLFRPTVRPSTGCLNQPSSPKERTNRTKSHILL